MSDTNEARDTAGLIDSDGRVIDETATDIVARVKASIEENPIGAVMIAVAVGYLLGRTRLII